MNPGEPSPDVEWSAAEGRFVELVYQSMLCEPQRAETPFRFIAAGVLIACLLIGMAFQGAAS